MSSEKERLTDTDEIDATVVLAGNARQNTTRTEPAEESRAEVPESSRQFRFLCNFAAGGVGCVGKARDLFFDRIVAVKKLNEKLRDNPRAVSAFFDECRLNARLDHPSIVPVYAMGKDESGDEESFSNGLLEYPQYTRPDCFEGLRVPEVLEGGNHALIAAWRRDQSVLATARHRPDLLDHAVLTHHDRQILRQSPRFRPAKNLFVALLHHPVRLKARKTGTTSLTNLDIHDIARISRTYGISGFFVVTPLKDQLRLLATLLSHWTEGPGLSFNPDRAEALRLVRPEESLESAIATLTTDRGLPPFVVGTSAQPVLDKKHRERRPATTFDEVRLRLADRPVLLLLGTGHGIAPEVLEQCDAILPPLRWMDEYNHLPVRAAAAILLDRLLGDRG